MLPLWSFDGSFFIPCNPHTHYHHSSLYILYLCNILYTCCISVHAEQCAHWIIRNNKCCIFGSAARSLLLYMFNRGEGFKAGAPSPLLKAPKSLPELSTTFSLTHTNLQLLKHPNRQSSFTAGGTRVSQDGVRRVKLEDKEVYVSLHFTGKAFFYLLVAGDDQLERQGWCIAVLEYSCLHTKKLVHSCCLSES